MGIADHLLGRSFEGQRKNHVWTIEEKIAQTVGHSPGQFSVAYKCRNADGQTAFMKASDLSKLIDADPRDIVGNIRKATNSYEFERQVLEHCSGNAMDRVVTAIDYGSFSEAFNGTIDVLFFLVFELAEGDLRKRVERKNSFDMLWIVSAMHDFCVAVQQMHGGEIYHNDIKPANGLVFSDGVSKVADLGRATTPAIPVAHDVLQCAGDRRFAPPEQLYRLSANIPVAERFNGFRAGDLYNLGSIGHYLITGRSVTLEIIGRMRPELRPLSFGGGWTDTIDEILPHWNTIYLDLLEEMKDSIPDDATDGAKEHFNKFSNVVKYLCEPYADRRGHPSVAGKTNRYDLQRFISSLDLQRSQLLVMSRNGR